ncbi:uncharacterized protein EAE97_009395 [Botrytis byssoidea]|uniref:Uncharacterized protein n=1 Tax=Botrytis byssoidea TaxID=139641 RepID=A0A9P5IDN0_9HELO|nr:uncharacterized protein EAE97_009395 [Botrytis byssoidea]KAF7931186.1 hypothetical protein EAE97_009395 [Botrytis byssoidea]
MEPELGGRSAAGSLLGGIGRWRGLLGLFDRKTSFFPIHPSPSVTTFSEGISPFRPQPIESTRSSAYISDDSTLLQKTKTRVLLLFEELPEWARDNEYILTTTNSDDAIAFCLCFPGRTVCYILSTVYHLFLNHSHATCLLCSKLDFLGILDVIAGSFTPGLWYTFPRASCQLNVTWIAVSITSIITFCSSI